jgi:hypothetical protein
MFRRRFAAGFEKPVFFRMGIAARYRHGFCNDFSRRRCRRFLNETKNAPGESGTFERGFFMQPFINQNEKESRKVLSHMGYYDVHIRVENEIFTCRVYARSDYAAAVQVRRLTGRMPCSERDVEFLSGMTAQAVPPTGKAFDMIAA